jgi:hypothetical protein
MEASDGSSRHVESLMKLVAPSMPPASADFRQCGQFRRRPRRALSGRRHDHADARLSALPRLALAPVAVAIARRPAGTTIVYGASLAIAALAFCRHCLFLGAGAPVTVTLPPASLARRAFSSRRAGGLLLVVVNLGAAAKPVCARLRPA